MRAMTAPVLPPPVAGAPLSASTTATAPSLRDRKVATRMRLSIALLRILSFTRLVSAHPNSD